MAPEMVQQPLAAAYFDRAVLDLQATHVFHRYAPGDHRQ